MEMFATCSFGLEALVKAELNELSIPLGRTEDARIFFTGDKEHCVRANLNLRCADRVFIKLASFEATSFEMLFEGMRALPWPNILPADAQIVVTGKTAMSDLVSVRDMQSIGKKAIVDTMMHKHKYAKCPETGAVYNIEIGMLRNEATIALNTSGAGLNRRGYRDLAAQAPLRETLAAAMVLLSHYNGDEVLYDPCCGSGTIAIEAAMIAARMAPGLHRTFAFDEWDNFGEAALAERQRAVSRQREGGFAHIEASDIDQKMVSMTHRHAKRAGVNGFINVTQRDAITLRPEVDRGVIVTNPPYGQRLDKQTGLDIAKALGKIHKDKPGIGVFALSADDDFARSFGRKADKRRKLYNGNKRCNLNMYFRARRRRPGGDAEPAE